LRKRGPAQARYHGRGEVAKRGEFDARKAAVADAREAALHKDDAKVASGGRAFPGQPLLQVRRRAWHAGRPAGKHRLQLDCRAPPCRVVHRVCIPGPAAAACQRQRRSPGRPGTLTCSHGGTEQADAAA